MNQAATEIAAQAYASAGTPADEAQDLGKAFNLLHGWMNSLSAAEKREMRAKLDALKAKTRKLAMVLCFIAASVTYLWLGGEDYRDQLHSVEVREMRIHQ